MPPYSPVKSKAQSRALFALARKGEISEQDARGKTRAADFETLPERVRDRDSDDRKPKRAPQGRAASAKRQALRRKQRQGR